MLRRGGMGRMVPGCSDLFRTRLKAAWKARGAVTRLTSPGTASLGVRIEARILQGWKLVA
jgi:hypothetical protein